MLLRSSDWKEQRGRREGVICLAMTKRENEELREMAEIVLGVGRETQ